MPLIEHFRTLFCVIFAENSDPQPQKHDLRAMKTDISFFHRKCGKDVRSQHVSTSSVLKKLRLSCQKLDQTSSNRHQHALSKQGMTRFEDMSRSHRCTFKNSLASTFRKLIRAVFCVVSSQNSDLHCQNFISCRSRGT